MINMKQKVWVTQIFFYHYRYIYLCSPGCSNRVTARLESYKFEVDIQVEERYKWWDNKVVARGFKQKKGIDSIEVFAPVTWLETVRLLLALSAKNGCEVHHLDEKINFLNGELVEEVCVTQPECFEKKYQKHMVYIYVVESTLRIRPSLNKCLKDLSSKDAHMSMLYTQESKVMNFNHSYLCIWYTCNRLT